MSFPKNGGWKKYLLSILAVTMLLSCTISAFADNVKTFLQGYSIGDGQIDVYCSNFSGTEGGYDAEQFTAEVGGQEAHILEVSTVERKGEGVTFYCLVDVSKSMTQEQLAQAKDVLRAVCNGMSAQDNMVIGAVGESPEKPEFLETPEEILAVIDGLTADADYTALYDSILSAISDLQSYNNCRQKKCLIIISDGADDTVIGARQEDVQGAIVSSRLPVYTVAALPKSYTQQQVTDAKLLGAFARMSVGGKDYAPLVDGADVQEAGNDIVQDNRSGLILTLDAPVVENVSGEIPLKIQLQNDNITYSDSVYLYASDLKYSQASESDTDTIDGADGSTDDGPEGTDKQKLPQPPVIPDDPDVTGDEQEQDYLPYIVIVVIVLLLIVAAVAVLIRRSVARKQKEDIEEESPDKVVVTEVKPKLRQEIPLVDTAMPERKYQVKFVAVGYENITYTLLLPEEKTVTIGRNQKADFVLNRDDRQLSSVHCKARCMKGVMNVWDMESRNGTFVNGVPIKQIGMATVQNGDVIRMGGYEYRVSIYTDK